MTLRIAGPTDEMTSRVEELRDAILDIYVAANRTGIETAIEASRTNLGTDEDFETAAAFARRFDRAEQVGRDYYRRLDAIPEDSDPAIQSILSHATGGGDRYES